MSRNPKLVSFKRSPAYVHHCAMLNRRENNIVDALELMRRAVDESPDNLEYRLDLAELYCEMGCHSQSTRLLLDMLAEGDAPSECYYGLALNQLGMNDVAGARQSLSLYRRTDPEGAHSEEVDQLSAELDMYSSMNRSASRKLRRAAHIADRACEAMKADDPDKACRLFEQSFELAPEQNEMRALYAMALVMRGDAQAARREADRACGALPTSVRALCVGAQVYALLGDADASRQAIDRAIAERPDGQELRLMIYTMGELRMHAEVAEHARLALQETPYDRDLLHMRAVALMHTGTAEKRLQRFWARILRIDPEDSIAQFYLEAARGETLRQLLPDYGYQVPAEEFKRRMHLLVSHIVKGYEHINEMWQQDAQFRQLVRWAIRSEDSRLSRAAITALATVDTRDSRSLLRELLFSAELPVDLKLHASLILRLQGLTPEQVLPSAKGFPEGVLPDPELLLAQMPVSERQLVRYADEVLEQEYDVSALQQLALMWSAYRQLRGLRTDPLRCIEGASAALAYNYLLIYGPKPEIQRLATAFNCAPRQLVYYARRIADAMEKIGESTSDENT